MTCALDADDPDLAGAAAWNLAMILSARGELERARSVVDRAVTELLPHLDRPSSARLAVFGGLHLLGATDAARQDKAAEAGIRRTSSGPRDVAVERRVTFRLDAARCYVGRHNDVAAVHMVQHIHRESPEELRYSVLVRQTLRQLRDRAKPSIEPDLRPLLEAADLPAQ